jgi:rSAM/selenodomain-associated transferase 1
MSDTALVIMARYQEAGKTKTRLARSLGDHEMAQLYQAFLTDLAQRFAGHVYDLHWAYTPSGVDFGAFIASLAPTQAQYMQYFPQQGDDLGARMLHAFQLACKRGYQRTIMIGSDIPHISPQLIAQAQTALDETDVVLGPADDGGYYLIAMRQPYDVFSDIVMSTSLVRQQTIERAQSQGLTVRLLDALFDIDEVADLLRLVELLAANRSLAPTTSALLSTFNLSAVSDDAVSEIALAASSTEEYKRSAT